MITREDIDRINFLARKSKENGLTEEEKEEQQKLRRKYIDWIKYQVKTQLDSITIVEKDHVHNHEHGCDCHRHHSDCDCHKH